MRGEIRVTSAPPVMPFGEPAKQRVSSQRHDQAASTFEARDQQRVHAAARNADEQRASAAARERQAGICQRPPKQPPPAPSSSRPIDRCRRSKSRASSPVKSGQFQRPAAHIQKNWRAEKVLSRDAEQRNFHCNQKSENQFLSVCGRFIAAGGSCGAGRRSSA